MNFYLPKPTATPLEIEQSPNSLREIRQWRAGLSMVNMGESARALFKTMQVLNRQNLDARLRLEIMEHVRPSARQVLTYLYKQMSVMTLPMPRRMSLIDQLVHSILQESSVGYKLCINSVLRDQVKLPQQELATCVHRAMRYLGESILQHEKTYSMIPEPLWHDLHRLQSFAETEKLTRCRIKDDDYRTLDHSSIPEAYKQVCVLYLCQPFRLRIGELESLRRFLETGSALVEMKKSLLSDDNGAVFVSSLRSSEGPAYVPLADITTFSNLRGFDMTALFEYLRSRRAGVEPDASIHDHLPPTLANRILHILTFQEKRRFSRVVTNRSATVAIGLASIIDAMQADTHPELSREQQFPASYGNGNGNPSAAIHEAKLRTNGPGVPAGIDLDSRSLYEDFFADDTGIAPSQHRQAPPSWSQWQVTNSGTAGYGLQWSSNEPCHARVGELVALREKEYDLYHWRIGIVRWVRNNQPDSIDIGIQVLAPRALIVKVPTHSRGETIQALMLPGMKPVKQPPSMIAPAHLFAVGDQLVINMLEKDLSIELRAEGENPGTYTQYFYKARQIAEAKKRKEDFDDLWSKL